MSVLFVVGHPRDFPLDIPGATLVTARDYLTDPAYGEDRHDRVINLCRADRYQNRGYYVSLLAEARGHQPLPDVKTIEDLRGDLAALVRAELAEEADAGLAAEPASVVDVDAYFGRDPRARHSALAQALFALLHAPLLRARFERAPSGWRLAKVRPLAASDIVPEHRAAFVAAALEHLGTASTRARDAAPSEPAIAILHTEGEPDSPSNGKAIARFRRAAESLGLRATTIGRDEADRIPEFDALFIRDTTSVDHYTYQFARRAAAEGLIVVDDPDSILKCSNKVYLNELLARHRIPVPRTLMVHRGNVGEIVPALGLPCILKEPDSAFSLGVAKVESEAALQQALAKLLAKSELVIAQEWLPTTFDWRIGVLDRRPLFVCQYFMAPGHWQVIKRGAGMRVEGSTAALCVGETPRMVVETAVRAANLIGDGFYGVDVKQVGDRCYVIEVNDNPNVDAGNEDAVLHDALYREVMGVFLRRIRERRARVGA